MTCDQPEPKFTSSGKGRGGAARNKGWSDAGIARFNELVKNVVYDRQSRIGIEFEEMLKKECWEKDLSTRKRRGDDTNLQRANKRREEPVDFVNELLDGSFFRND